MKSVESPNERTNKILYNKRNEEVTMSEVRNDEITKDTNRAMDPRRRLDQLINLAFDSVEEDILTKKASPSVLNALLRMGTERDLLETENLRTKSELNKSRIKEIDEKASQKQLMEDALSAIKSYRGESDD